MIGDFTFRRRSQILPIYRIFARGPFRGTGAQQLNRLVLNKRNPLPTDADVARNLGFYLSGMIADHRSSPELVGKMETLSMLQICPRSSKTIGDVYYLEFSLVGKIWDGWETIKHLGFSLHMKTRLKSAFL